jgi:ABC-type glycerol-3-phosphate transport system substrate-binding protein
MVRCRLLVALFLAGLLVSPVAGAATITIATVNNNDMIIMQKLSRNWERQTGNTVNWVVLEENVLRQRVTTDIATHGGQFDIVTIGSYETPIWGRQGWLVPLSGLPARYDSGDIFPAVRDALSVKGVLYALPIYAESSMTYYRTDLFRKAGLTMPEHPSYDEIRRFADRLTDRAHEQYGICLRGKPGWGENMALFDTLVNTFGGRWFDGNWQPQLTARPWHEALGFYVATLREDGPPGASSNGYNENRALFASGHCAMWIDATSAAGSLYSRSESQVADVTGFTAAPIQATPHGANWFWSWALGIPATSKRIDAAKSFLEWATSKDYVTMVGVTQGWTLAPPGTRASTYENPGYQKAAPFAAQVRQAILTADLNHPTAQPVPYTGIQYVAIPEFQAIGTQVGQLVAAVLTGNTGADDALRQAEATTLSAMQQAGYTQ